VVVPLTAGGAGRVAAALRRWLPSGTADTDQLLRGVTDLSSPERRRAFLATVRTVIDRSGQMVSAEPLLYLAAGIPTLLLWGARDRIIPAEHGQLAHASLPSSRLVVLPHAGHFPHLDDPAQVAAAVAAFLASTDPASADPDAWRARLLAGPPAAGRG
jgi:pimeloyl-ACP methyl ester carboxylesterase